MTLKLTSLINKVQTIDAVDIGPFVVQTRSGNSITSDIATAVVLRKLQCDVLVGADAKWADEEGTALVKPDGTTVPVVAVGQTTDVVIPEIGTLHFVNGIMTNMEVP